MQLFFVLRRTLEYDIFKGTFGLSFFPPRCLQRQANLLLRRLLPPPPPLQAPPPQHQGEGGEEGGLLAGVSQHSQLDPHGGLLIPDVINGVIILEFILVWGQSARPITRRGRKNMETEKSLCKL